MVAHTPGPWHVAGAWGRDIDDGEGHHLALVHQDHYDNPLPGEANARLIAAAPAMLAALERVQKGLTLLEPEFRSGPLGVIGTMREAVNTAIAQARGEATNA